MVRRLGGEFPPIGGVYEARNAAHAAQLIGAGYAEPLDAAKADEGAPEVDVELEALRSEAAELGIEPGRKSAQTLTRLIDEARNGAEDPDGA